MSTYSLSNFAVISKQNILIYDNNGRLRHSIIPLESNFLNLHYNCIIEVDRINGRNNIILDFSSESEALQAREKLSSLKSQIQYSIRWVDINDKPTTVSGYGITNTYTKQEIDVKYGSGTTDLSGYYTSAQTNTNFLSANTILNESLGITLNNKYIAGVKNYIEINDILNIPEYYEYNVNKLNIDGTINLDGEINL